MQLLGAAEQGDPEAMLELSRFYLAQHMRELPGVETAGTRAGMPWLERAAAAGNPAAMAMLAEVKYDGLYGVAVDCTAAVRQLANQKKKKGGGG